MQIRADCFRSPDSFGICIAALPHLERNYNFAFIETGIPEEEQSLLDALLLAQMWKGHFRYDLTTSEIKVISGRVKFLTQLNEGWNMDYLSKAEDNKASTVPNCAILIIINACYFPDHLPVDLMPVDTFFTDGRTETRANAFLSSSIMAVNPLCLLLAKKSEHIDVSTFT
ncbi:hypothetical protein LWI29_007018 [Acer saccharum]|uniref:GDPGP1-like N-terminal domain-containing protein n=1 Tax=Acer saccharum TaxID=4024 RepID=A0AA39RQD8_ACESA|nr:hypothetical protein LWI29_007018 [Acer saccharum]